MTLKYTTLSLVLTIGLGQPVLAADGAKPATEVTKEANAAVLKALPFGNKQAYDDSGKGFIAPLDNNGMVKDAKGRITFDLSRYDFLKGDAPASTCSRTTGRGTCASRCCSRTRWRRSIASP